MVEILTRAMLALVLATSHTACGGEVAGQLIVHVNTDAPLPPGDGEVTAARPTVLFDTVRVDVHRAGALAPCAACSRTFAVDEAMVRRGEASFGVVGNEDAVARVRLYLSRVEVGSEPSAAGSIEAWVELPAVTEDRLRHITVTLPTDEVGGSLGSLAAPIEAEEGEPSPSLVGS